MPDDRIDPLEKLAAAHRSLEENLNDLARAARALSDPRGRAAALEGLSSVIAYFERSINRHQEDEERSLFPRLAVLEAIAPTLERLRQEHKAHQRAIDALRAAIERDGGAAAAEVLPQLIEELRAAYHRHVTCEEQEVFPAARRFLQPSAMQGIMHEMETRRGRGGHGNPAKGISGRPYRPGGMRRGP
ncbi:hemerythrin domain-containing protein [Sorangium sp. So ce1024]|uniref:hemerythrin domain-containing protein n=1 Tax=unclassified Sorangium TaxID=2621164 RepID=UPI003EFE2A08